MISFYSGHRSYAEAAMRLRARCNVLGIPHHIAELPDTGSWASNNRQKPKFIRETLEYLGRPVLWLDADSELVAPPRLPPETSDVAAFQLRNPVMVKGFPPVEIAAFALYCNDTPEAVGFLHDWESRCSSLTPATDHLFLGATWAQHDGSRRGYLRARFAIQKDANHRARTDDLAAIYASRRRKATI